VIVVGGCGLSFEKIEIGGVDKGRTYKADSAEGMFYNLYTRGAE
jgi:hypothetical protein